MHRIDGLVHGASRSRGIFAVLVQLELAFDAGNRAVRTFDSRDCVALLMHSGIGVAMYRELISAVNVCYRISYRIAVDYCLQFDTAFSLISRAFDLNPRID